MSTQTSLFLKNSKYSLDLGGKEGGDRDMTHNKLYIVHKKRSYVIVEVVLRSMN